MVFLGAKLIINIMRRIRLRKRLTLFLLLLMEMGTCSVPPSIPYLVVRDGGEDLTVFSNRSYGYAPKSFDGFSIRCKSSTTSEEETKYFWNMEKIGLPSADSEFAFTGGTLEFLTENFGLFECYASTELGKSYAVVKLLPSLMEDESSSLVFLDGPRSINVAQHTDVQINCEVKSNKAVKFDWTFNTEPVVTSKPEWIVEKVSPTKELLLISGVTKNDVGNVGCMVGSLPKLEDKRYQEGIINVEEGGASETTEIMGQAPVIISEIRENVVLFEGDMLDVQCEASGVPEPNIGWQQDSQHLSASDASGRLLIDNIDKSREGTFVCVATNSYGQAEKETLVTVFSHTKMTNQEMDRQIEVHLGSDVRLECHYELDENLVSSYEVTWIKGDQAVEEIMDNTRTEASVNMDVLVIQNVGMDDGGSYSCVVETSWDRAAHEWDITVVRASQITMFESSKTLLLNSDVVIPCEAQGIPLPKIEWLFNNTPVVDDERRYVKEDGELKIEKVTRDDEGELKCVATNSHGKDERTLNISVARPTSVSQVREEIVYRNAGDTISMLCAANIDPLLEQTTTRTWSKDGVEVEHSLVDISDKAKLDIPYLMGEHSGTYVCLVKTKLDTATVEKKLEVVTMKPRIADLPSHLGQISGGQLDLTCTALGIPPPTISFTFGSDQFTGSVVERTGNSTTSRLGIGEVTIDNAGKYTCLAVNIYGQDRAQTKVAVYARTVMIQGPMDQVANSSTSVNIPCQVNADARIRPSLRVHWQKNEQYISGDERVVLGEDKLTINEVVKRDEGIYTCVAQTDYDAISTSGRLTVLSEAPSFTSTPKDIRVLERRNVNLICQAAGNPQPSITWRQNEGNELPSIGGKLSLTSVSPSMEGTYICMADNMYGTIETRVNVQVIKSVRKEIDNLIPDIVKNVRDTVDLPCEFSVDHRVAKETRVIWMKELTEVPVDNVKYSVNADKSLVIKDVVLGDEGQYTCKVITPLQEVESKISLIVSGESPQILNKFKKITIHEGDNLNISCLARGVPKPKLEWLLKDRTVAKQYLSSIETANDEFTETKITIKSVTKSHEGVYQCEAKNNVGTVVKNSHISVISRTKVFITNDSPKEITSAAGQKLKLPCKYSNDPMNRITNLIWMKNGKTLENSADLGIDRGYDGSITFKNVQKQHEGRYKCTVVTVMDQASDQVQLKVLVNAPVITNFTPDKKVFSGTSLVVECISNGIPEPMTKWTFNETITHKVGPMYAINNAIATDAGAYTCTARNSIGETRKTVRISVVTLPTVKKDEHTTKGAKLKLPCVKPDKDVLVVWRKDGEGLGGDNMDSQGSIVIDEIAEADEGNYTCLVQIVGGEKRLLQTKVRIVPDIVTSSNTRVDVREGENITLKCNVLPGINAKRMWKKNGDLVFPGSGSNMEISDQGGMLTLSFAKVSNSGEFACVATTCFGEPLYTCINPVKETIFYEVTVQPLSSKSRDSCSTIDPAVITSIESVSNTSVRLEWSATNFNASCHEVFRIFWWTNESRASYDKRVVELSHRTALIEGLRPEMAYYFQVNLVRNEALGQYIYGQTKTHMMQLIQPIKLPHVIYPKAVIIIVIIVIVILATILLLIYYKRKEVGVFRCREYIIERKKNKKNQHEFAEFNSKLVANPDFMASLSPQWPEPEPDPTEEVAFIQQQNRLSVPGGSRDNVSLSSWSSLFNVVSNDNINHIKDEGTWGKGRTRRE